MACFHPLHGYRAVGGGISFALRGSTGLPFTVPCGQCIGCRLERSRQWAVRCMHEASLHEDSCFITLTYCDEYLPADRSLDRSAFPRFMKRLRKRCGKVRYFHCGEYGDENGRPHYHALLFGLGFSDRVCWSNRGGNQVWRSPTLEELWPFGQSEIGSVTFESAAYVARYCVKKVTGSRAEEHYGGREPEYATMSRRPGIGAGWFERFASDVYPADEVIVRGRKCKPARYYDEKLRAESPDEAARVSRRRRESRDRTNESAERLRVREVCAEARVSLSRRDV